MKMDVNRIAIEALLAGFLVAVAAQVARFSYQSYQINYVVYLALKLAVLAVALAAVCYLKKNSDFGETALLSSLVFVAIWIGN